MMIFPVTRRRGAERVVTLLDGLVAQVTGLDLRVAPLQPPATDVVRVGG